eukprot:762129-Hanusia_phi.AAC.1
MSSDPNVHPEVKERREEGEEREEGGARGGRSKRREEQEEGGGREVWNEESQHVGAICNVDCAIRAYEEEDKHFRSLEHAIICTFPDITTYQAKTIVEKFRKDLEEYHGLVGGRLVAIHDMLNSIAMTHGKPPLPPPAVAFLCDVSEEQVKNQGSDGPIVSCDQLVSCFSKMIPAKDTPEIFEEKVAQQLCLALPLRVREASKRRRHSNAVMPELKPKLEALHAKTEGNPDKLYAWFLDLIPADNKEGFPKEAFLAVIMRCPPDATQIPLKNFISGKSFLECKPIGLSHV